MPDSNTTLIEELLSLQFPKSISISPNAQKIVYTTTNPGNNKTGEHRVSTIWLAETGKPKSARQLTSGLYSDANPLWSPDGKSIAFISDRAKAGESSAIYILPISEGGGEAYPITPAENEKSIEGFDWSPRGDFIAYISADEKTAEKKAKEKDKDDANVWGEDWEYQRLRIVHVSTKKVTTLVSRDANVEEFAWNDDGTKIAFAETRTPHIESVYLHGTKISIVNVTGKEITSKCSFPSSVEDLTWAGDSLYFIAAVTPSTTVTANMVYQIDLSASSAKCEKYAHGEEDCAWDLRKVDKDVVVHVKSGLESHVRMLGGRIILQRKQELDAWDAQFTTDSDEMIIAACVSTPSSPPEVYSTTASGGALVQLSDHGAALSSTKDFGTATFLTCDSKSVKGEDPVRLDAVFIAPSSSSSSTSRNPSSEQPAKPHPTIVIPHGGPYSRSINHFTSLPYMWPPLLLSAGYAILLPNYRGSCGRGESFAAYCRGGTGVYDYEDVITLTQHAIEKGLVDKERLVVGGWSQGGFLSYLSATRNGMHGYGWKWRGAIPGAGVSEADTMCLTSDIGCFQADLAGKAPWELPPSSTASRSGSALWEFEEARREGRIPPMLILHGEKDERVPIEQAAGFRRALDSMKKRGDGPGFEYVTYPREPHLVAERKHLVDMAERVLRFVDMCIGGR